MTINAWTWLLAGALAASLAWNVRGALQGPVGPASCGPAGCSTEGCAEVLGALDLSEEQRAALAAWSAASCGSAARLEADAEAKSAELFAALAAPDLDPELARRLADETSELRTRSLSSCVDSLLAVRRHLKPQQVERLLETCCGPTR